MKQVFAIMLVAVSFTACKKEKVDSPVVTPPVAVAKKLTSQSTSYSDGSVESKAYSYDGQNRISAIEDGAYVQTFDYSTSGIIKNTRRAKATNAIISTKEYILNAAGRVEAVIGRNAANAIIGSVAYTYDANGYMVKQKYTYTSSIHEYEYVVVNGNYVSSTYKKDGLPAETTQFTVDASVSNNGGMIECFGDFPSDNLFGVPLKNTFKEIKSYNTSGALIWHAQRSFQSNTDGTVAKQSFKNMITNYSSTTTYTY